MSFQVFIISDAENDIIESYEYVLYNDSRQKANDVFIEIQNACESLSELPERGHLPPELKNIGVLDYREIHCKPYRIIYQITGNKVFVHCVLHGKRDIKELLEKRLIR
jgi:toxin ParE1/3/4